MKILIDLEKIFKLNLTANEYIMLLSYYMDHKGFELYSEILRSVNLPKLEVLGYIKIMEDNSISIRGKAANLFKDLNLDKPEQSEDIVTVKVDPRLTEEFLIQYRDLWPKGVSSGGRLLRQSIKSLEAKFKNFFTKYDYTTLEILNATTAYIKRFSYKQYMGITCSDYFVEKFNVSVLASEIDNIREKGNIRTNLDHRDLSSGNGDSI